MGLHELEGEVMMSCPNCGIDIGFDNEAMGDAPLDPEVKKLRTQNAKLLKALNAVKVEVEAGIGLKEARRDASAMLDVAEECKRIAAKAIKAAT